MTFMEANVALIQANIDKKVAAALLDVAEEDLEQAIKRRDTASYNWDVARSAYRKASIVRAEAYQELMAKKEAAK
jgi:hypothetical protein